MHPKQSLHQAPIGRVYRIATVHPSDRMPDCARQLSELGFLPGEQIVVLRRTMPGADPLVVRIGVSTFALRQAEAACIELVSDDA
jgi:ferrous iron transport protein A